MPSTAPRYAALAMDAAVTAPPVTSPPIASPREPALDAEGRLLDDLACRSCGYSLRGLPASGACPECATAVGRSIHGDLLRFCEPAWVERVAGGVRLLVIGFLVSILGGIALSIVAAVVFALRSSVGMAAIWALGIAFVAYLLGVSALNICGYWLATSRDPGRDESEQPLTVRAVARWGIVASSILALLELPFNGMMSGFLALPGITPQAHVIIDATLGGLSQGFGVVGMVALILYAAQLARRLPEDRLARSCRTVAVGYAISGSVLLVGTVLAGLGQSNPTGTLTIVGGILSFIGGLPGLVFGIWAIVLLFRFRARLRTAAREARETWARAGSK